MAKTKVILFLFVFAFILFNFSFVSAIPPVQTTIILDKGIQLESPLIDNHEVNQSFKFNVHAHNSTNGLSLDNTTTQCIIHLFRPSDGDHIMEQNMSFDSNGIDFETEITGGNFTEIGQYIVLFYCEAPGEIGGFLEHPFIVSYGGEELTTPQALVYILLFSILGFIFVMIMFFIDKLPSSNTKDEEGKILSISYLKYLRATFWFVEWIIFVGIIFLASNVAFAYLSENMFAKILFAFFTMCLALTPLILAVWIIWIFVKMFHDKEFQRLLNRGFFPQGKL